MYVSVEEEEEEEAAVVVSPLLFLVLCILSVEVEEEGGVWLLK
jgi:hypothetical protein